MSHAIFRHWLVRMALIAAVLASVAVIAGCNADNGGSTSTPPSESGPPAVDSSTQKQVEPPPPEYSHWLVYINDDASMSQGGMTYDVALNLKATNKSSDPSGKYTGKATAKTSTAGDVGGAQLNASAIANSSNLQFTLNATPVASESGGTLDDPLAPLVPDHYTYTGSGTITMKAAGSGTVGRAGGSFSNTSGQHFTLSGSGSDITMTIAIGGKKFKFKGTIRGEE